MVYKVTSVAILIALTATALPAQACSIPANQPAVTAQFASWINAFRAENGLGPLAPSAALSKAARDHSCDMADHDQMTHASSDGGTLRERLAKVRYRSRRAAENVARSSRAPDAQIAVELWVNSQGHRRNMLDPNLREMGFAVAQGAHGHSFYTFVGGEPR